MKAVAEALPVDGLPLWTRQVSAVIGSEMGKMLTTRSGLLAVFLALLPVLLAVVIGVADRYGEPVAGTVDGARRLFSILYSGFILGGVIFIGSAAIFSTLFRGEILGRSMHYYLLSPIRREALVAGKFAAGYIIAVLLFGLATCLSYLLMYMPFGVGALVNDIASGRLLDQMFSYLGITLLATLGYGAIFLVTGLLFRNPLLPVAAVAGWELIHFLLPPVLKSVGVIYYVKGLLPVPLDDGPLAVVVAAPPVGVAVFALTALAVVCLGLTSWLVKRLEVDYAGE